MAQHQGFFPQYSILKGKGNRTVLITQIMTLVVLMQQDIPIARLVDYFGFTIAGNLFGAIVPKGNLAIYINKIDSFVQMVQHGPIKSLSAFHDHSSLSKRPQLHHANKVYSLLIPIFLPHRRSISIFIFRNRNAQLNRFRDMIIGDHLLPRQIGNRLRYFYDPVVRAGIQFHFFKSLTQ